MDFKKLFRFSIFLIIFLIINIMKTNVLADETFVRVCKYYNKDTDINVFVKWRSDKHAPSLYGPNDNYLGLLKYIGTTKQLFLNGCLANINVIKSITGEIVITMSDKIGTTTNDYHFAGIVSEGDDVLYSGSFSESIDNPDANIFLDYTVNCSYTLPSKYNVVLKIGVGGGITVTSKDENGKNRGVKLKKPAEIFKSINEKKICPPTICYNKNNGRKDVITFYSSSNAKCSKRGFGLETNSLTDRQRKEQDKLSIFVPADKRAEADQLKEDVSDTSDMYINCLKLLDSSDKCGLKESNLVLRCRDTDEVNIACNQAKREYIECIEKEYTREEIELKCGVQEEIYNQAQDALIEYGNETRDPTVNVIVTKKYGNPDDFKPELKPITKKEILGEDLIKWLNSAFLLIQIGAIVISIILTMLDVLKAVASSDEGATKKIFKNMTIRFIIIAIFLLLPILIEFILGLIDVPNKNPLN